MFYCFCSSTAGSSSSEEDSESDDDVIKMEGNDVIRNVDISKNSVQSEEGPRRKSEGQDPMEPHPKKSKANAPHLIKRSKSVPGGLSRQVSTSSTDSERRSFPLSKKEMVKKPIRIGSLPRSAVVFRRKTPVNPPEKKDMAIDPMDDFDMEGPGVVLFPSKSLNKSLGQNTTDREIAKMNGCGGKNKNKVLVPNDAKMDTLKDKTNTKDSINTKPGQKEATPKLNGKEPSPKVILKLKDSKSHSKEHTSKPSSKDSAKSNCKEAASRVNSKEPSPKLSCKDSSPKDADDKPRPSLTLKIKCDTTGLDKKDKAERSSLSPRSYVIASSSLDLNKEDSLNNKRTPPSGDNHKRSRSSSSDSSRSSKSKERRASSSSKTSPSDAGKTEEMVVHYVTKLSPGSESGKSPPSQREPIKMTITKSQISPPLKGQISPPLKVQIPPPHKESGKEPSMKSPPLPTSSNSTPISTSTPVSATPLGTSTPLSTLTPLSTSIDCKAESVQSDKNGGVAIESKSPQISPVLRDNHQKNSAKKEPSGNQKRKSLEDKVFQLHKAKQNQLLNKVATLGQGEKSGSETGTNNVDPYQFPCDGETPKSAGTKSCTDTCTPNGSITMSVKMEGQTKIKIKKDTGTSPNESELEIIHRRPPIMNSQRLLKPQPQPDRKPGQSGAISTPTSHPKSPANAKPSLQSTAGNLSLTVPMPRVSSTEQKPIVQALQVSSVSNMLLFNYGLLNINVN